MAMKPTALICMDRPGRLRKKAKAYLADMDAFLADIPGAITVLLNTLPHADPLLAVKILPLLGAAGKDRVLWPLFDVMMDPSVDEVIRRAAAVQLGLAASLSENPSVLITELIATLDHRDPLIRGGSALALGWEANATAIPALMSHLQDADRDVQAAVVAALSSIGDALVFDRLTQRLTEGALEEQRSIVLNLWRFAESTPRVERVYLDCLDWLPVELYPDILSGVAMIPQTTVILSIYRRMLEEGDVHLRLKALENLEALDPEDYTSLNGHLRLLLTNEEDRVRQAVTRLLAKHAPG